MFRLLKNIGISTLILTTLLVSNFPFAIPKVKAAGQLVPHVVGFNPSALSASYYTGGVMANGSASATEAEVQFYVTKAGTYSGLSVNVTAANATGDSTVVFRKNGADGNNTVTISSTLTGLFQDTTHTDTVAVGDLVNFNLTYTAGTATFSSWTIFFEADDGSTTQFLMTAGAPASFANNNTTRYNYPVGPLITTLLTEPIAQNIINHDSVLSNFATYVGVNGRTTTTTFRTRINGANGAQSVGFTTGVTGLLRDTSNTDTITAGDLLNFSFATAGSGGNLDIKNMQATLTSDTPEEITILGGSAYLRSSNASSFYGRVNGSLGSASGTEAQNRVYLGVDGDVSMFGMYVSANASNRDMNVFFRVSGADGTNTFANLQTETGWEQDTTHTDAITSSDYVAFRSVVASGGTGAGNVTYNAVTFLVTLPSLATTFTPIIMWF